jgi:uncharacterized SAM-binding protein YcdF (DUF218 family)
LIYLLVKALAVPPGPQIVLGVAGLICLGRWQRLACVLLGLSIGSTWLLATPFGAGALARLLERDPVVYIERALADAPEAIVVLGGGTYGDAPEFGDYDEVSVKTLERLRYGARLQPLTALPLAVTGGYAGLIAVPEGVAMTTVLEADFKVPVEWAEIESRDTAENARLSAKRFPFRRILLVTHAVHMRRAARAFRDAGFEVIPAPMGFISRPRATGWSVIDFVPDIKSFGHSSYVVYEMVGALWYALRQGPVSSSSLGAVASTRARKPPCARSVSTSSLAQSVAASRTMLPSGAVTMA